MANKIETVWQYVVKCAVSVQLESSVKEIVLQYISRNKKCSQEDAKTLYQRYAEQNTMNDGRYVTLNQIGQCIGVVAMVIFVPSLIATRFNIVFVILTLLDISLIRGCGNYIKMAKRYMKAADIWKNALQSGSTEQLNQAFSQMEQVFLTGKNI